jgi:hypothetical protein
LVKYSRGGAAVGGALDDGGVQGLLDGIDEAMTPSRKRGWRRLCMAFAVVLVAGWALVVWHGNANDPEIGGYPQRIGFERPSDGLPSRPGPLAATLYDNDFGNGRMLGVTATGRLWELPLGAAALSPSGRLLLTQRWDQHQVLMQDLTTGDRRVLRNISTAAGVESSMRVFWTQDETAVLGNFGQAPHLARDHPGILDLSTGALTDVGPGEPAGFLFSSEAVTVRTIGRSSAIEGITATATDVGTGATRELPLRLAHPWRGDPDASLGASISPDGRTLILIEAGTGFTTDGTVRMFAMADGTELPPRSVSNWDHCPPSWLGQDPVIPTTTYQDGPGSSRWAGAELLTENGSRSLVAVHPRLQSACLQLTADALEAGPRWALLGSSTAVWTWFVSPPLITASLLLLGLLVLIRTIRQRRTASPG